jgi:hypothetical protein
MAKFPFNDLHSFKDYVGFVKLCAPDMFPQRVGVSPDDQWNVDLAFKGLREGLSMAAVEKGPRPVFAECEALVDEAYREYAAGDIKGGYMKLDEVYQRLKEIPS